MPEELRSRLRGRYVFEHQGDAMMPDFRHGDVAIVDDRNRKPMPSGLFLIVEDGVEVIRRLMVTGRAVDAATGEALPRTRSWSGS